ncbi:hypothetical protein [Bradyrhizobium elkanii]|jgi:hypothetical protein
MGTAIPARSSGDQTINYLRAPITFAIGNSGVVNVGTLPAGCLVLRSYTVITTAFNAGTTNTIGIGTSGSPTTFGATIALGTLGANAGTIAASANVAPTSDTLVIATSSSTGTVATAGAGFVVVEYMPVA